jgi:hypothetical protein
MAKERFNEVRGGLAAVFSRLFRDIRLHPYLEPLGRTAQVAAYIAQFLGAKYQNHNQQYDQPMPNTERTHISLLC